jgi:hypothetical protein
LPLYLMNLNTVSGKSNMICTSGNDIQKWITNVYVIVPAGFTIQSEALDGNKTSHVLRTCFNRCT